MSETKNRLIALIFDDPYKADEARAVMNRMGGEGLLEIDETTVIIKKADGKVRMSQDFNVVGKNQKIGHIIGLVAAAVTGSPPFIMAGNLSAPLLGRVTDHVITNKFVKRVSQELQPGTSALILLTRSGLDRRMMVVERLRVFAPKILESDLPQELEQELKQSLQEYSVNLQ